MKDFHNTLNQTDITKEVYEMHKKYGIHLA